MTTWQAAYPTSQSDDNVVAGTGFSCALCHFSTTGGANWNAYGWKMRQGVQAGQSLAAAIGSAGPFDSDLDPTASTNLTEIGANSQPGWTPGAHNTQFFKTSSQINLTPPAGIQGSLDPSCNGSVISFCTAKTTSNGCAPVIASSGTPSATAGNGFVVKATGMINNKSCLLFYGTTGQAAGAFQGGTLCVKAPIKRTPGTTTGGNPPPNDCSGVPSIDMNAFAVGGIGGTPLPALTIPGTVVNCQWWGRDPGYTAPNNTQLSNGLQYTICN